MALWSLVTNKLGFMLTAYYSPSPPHSAQAQIQYIAAYQGAGKLQLSFSFKKMWSGKSRAILVQWEQWDAALANPVKAPCLAVFRSSWLLCIWNYCIITYLKIFFFALFSPWPFDLWTFRNLSFCHPWLNHVKEYDRFLLGNLVTISQSFFTSTFFRTSRFHIYGPSFVTPASICTFSSVCIISTVCPEKQKIPGYFNGGDLTLGISYMCNRAETPSKWCWINLEANKISKLLHPKG